VAFSTNGPTETAEQVALESPDDIALADRMKDGADQIRTELHKLIVGQSSVIEHMLLTLFVGGNSLIIGVPGLAKTLLVHTLAKVLSLKFNRVQFEPMAVGSRGAGRR
jgi:MoxR-like ATPase